MIKSGKEILESNIGSWDYDYEGIQKAIDLQLAEILAICKPIAEDFKSFENSKFTDAKPKDYERRLVALVAELENQLEVK